MKIDGNKEKQGSKQNPRTHTPLHNKLEGAPTLAQKFLQCMRNTKLI